MRRRQQSVCPPDCPERSADGHSVCKKYLRFRADQEKEYERRKDRMCLKGYSIDAYRACRHASPYPAGCRKNRGDKTTG